MNYKKTMDNIINTIDIIGDFIEEDGYMTIIPSLIKKVKGVKYTGRSRRSIAYQYNKNCINLTIQKKLYNTIPEKGITKIITDFL